MPAPAAIIGKEKSMNKDNRVLSRIGARELSEQEVANVTGGFRTLTVCTFFNGKVDGDTGEC